MPSDYTLYKIIFYSLDPLGPQLRPSEIARRLKVSRDVIKHTLQLWEDTKNIRGKASPGRPRKTTVKEDNTIIKLAERRAEEGSEKLVGRLKRKNIEISERTVRRRIEEEGFQSGHPILKPLLTSTPMENRLFWANQHSDEDWQRVIFTNEATFHLYTPVPWTRWRPGQRPVGRTVKYPAKIHAWGCFSSHGFGKLVLFQGNLTGKKLTNIYAHGLLSSANNMFTGQWKLQEDNDPKHMSHVAKAWKQTHNITHLPWPSQSPDQNPMENVWAVLKMNVAQHHAWTMKTLCKVI